MPYTITVADIKATVKVIFKAFQGAPNHSFGVQLDRFGKITTTLLDDLGYQVRIQGKDPVVNQDGIYKDIKQNFVISIE